VGGAGGGGGGGWGGVPGGWGFGGGGFRPVTEKIQITGGAGTFFVLFSNREEITPNRFRRGGGEGNRWGGPPRKGGGAQRMSRPLALRSTGGSFDLVRRPILGFASHGGGWWGPGPTMRVGGDSPPGAGQREVNSGVGFEPFVLGGGGGVFLAGHPGPAQKLFLLVSKKIN